MEDPVNHSQWNLESGPKKPAKIFCCTHCVKSKKKNTNLIKSANCPIPKWYITCDWRPFLWFLGQLLSKNSILKILQFFQKNSYPKQKSKMDYRWWFNFFSKIAKFPKALKIKTILAFWSILKQRVYGAIHIWYPIFG